MKGKSLEVMYDTNEVAKNVNPVDFFLPHMIKYIPFIRIAIFLLSCPVQKHRLSASSKILLSFTQKQEIV